MSYIILTEKTRQRAYPGKDEEMLLSGRSITLTYMENNQMDVYVVEVSYDYEGFDIIGVFTSIEKANKVLATIDWGDSKGIVQYTLDEVDETVMY